MLTNRKPFYKKIAIVTGLLIFPGHFLLISLGSLFGFTDVTMNYSILLVFIALPLFFYSKTYSKHNSLMFLFFLYYFIKVIIDYIYFDFQVTSMSLLYYLALSVTSMLVPFVSGYFLSKYYSFTIERLIVVLSIISLFIILISILLTGDIFYGRVSDKIIGLGPIIYGHFALSILIFSFFYKKMAFIIVPVALVIIMASGTRSALLASMIVTVFYLMKRIDKRFIVVLVIIIGVGVVYEQEIIQFISRFSLYQRTINMQDEGLKNVRLSIYEASFNEFLSNPIFGNHLRLSESSYYADAYPHNFILEILSVLGIMGVVLFLRNFIFALKNAFTSQYEAMSLIFIQMLVFSLLSSSIATNFLLWFFIGFFNFRKK